MKSIITVLLLFFIVPAIAQSVPASDNNKTADTTKDEWYFFDDVALPDSIYTYRDEVYPIRYKKVSDIGTKKGYNTKEYDITLYAAQRLIINIYPSGFTPVIALYFPDGSSRVYTDGVQNITSIHIDTFAVENGSYKLVVCADKEETTGDAEFYLSQYICYAPAVKFPSSNNLKDKLQYLEKMGNTGFGFIRGKENNDIDLVYKTDFLFFDEPNTAYLNNAPDAYTQVLARDLSKSDAEKKYTYYLTKLPECIDASWKQMQAETETWQPLQTTYRKCEEPEKCRYFEKIELYVRQNLLNNYDVYFKYTPASRFL